MKPLDPRLLRHARAARRHIVLTAVLGFTTAGLVVAQGLLLARALAPVIGQTATLFEVMPMLGWLAAVFAARAVIAWAQERYAVRAATETIGELREQVIAHAVALGPRWLSSGRGPALATLATRGLDALEPYFVRYLPQLLLAATVTPATLAVVLGLDWISAVIIAGTIPLVPLFMILVGLLTQGTSQRRLVVMQRLGAQVLDLLAGLPTLRALGRALGPEQRVRALGEANRKATMGTLRVAFLSGMVLELLTTLSVALVAVGVGLRLVYGHLDLVTGLAVIILAPEVYLPLRQVGAHFHASTDGMAAAAQAFAVLAEPLRPHGGIPAPRISEAGIAFEGVSVRAGERDLLAPSNLSAVLIASDSRGQPRRDELESVSRSDELTAEQPWMEATTGVRPGRIVALTGPSGSGKTTAALVLLGLVAPDSGRVVITPRDGRALELGELDPRTWWSQIAWVPQRPVLAPGTIRDAVLRFRAVGSDPAATGRASAATLEPGWQSGTAGEEPALLAAARLTGLDEVVASLPDGWDTRIGQGGVGLSVGQRQRVALTAGLLGDAREVPLVLLDEPTAHLDARSEQAVLAALQAWRAQGRTVVVIAHRPALVALADVVIPVVSAQLAPDVAREAK